MRVSTVTAFGAVLALTAAMSVVPLQVAGAQSPSTSVLVPSSGATLSGSTYLDASAPNATSVEFLLFGGSYGFAAPEICTATSTLYGWLCDWNTMTVPDSGYVLVSEASGPGGTAFSSGISINVNNPSTKVIIPANGATLDDAAGWILDATASAGATSVTFEVDGYPLTATLTLYGWIYVMPATPPCAGLLPAGQCLRLPLSNDLQSVATYPGGVTVTSPTLIDTFVYYEPEVALP